MSTSATSLVSEAVSSASATSTKQYSTSVTNAGSIGQAKNAHATYRAVAISGMLSLVSGRLPLSHAAPLKESKAKRSLNNFILRIRRLFQVLGSVVEPRLSRNLRSEHIQALTTYSIVELLNVTSALMAPVRMGMVGPLSIQLSNASTVDVIDAIEKHLNNETDLTTLLHNNRSVHSLKKVLMIFDL